MGRPPFGVPLDHIMRALARGWSYDQVANEVGLKENGLRSRLAREFPGTYGSERATLIVIEWLPRANPTVRDELCDEAKAWQEATKDVSPDPRLMSGLNNPHTWPMGYTQLVTYLRTTTQVLNDFIEKLVPEPLESRRRYLTVMLYLLHHKTF